MDVRHASDIQQLQLQRFPWFFHLLAVVGALYLGAVMFRLLAYLGFPNSLFLRWPTTDLRRRYGAWAVVTGPTSGIGRSMAFELARRGLNVVLVGRDPDKLRDVSDTITKTHAGVQTKTVVFDLSFVSTAQGDEAMRRLREAVDGLDVGVLVNNAGVAKPCAVYLHEFDVDAWVNDTGEPVGADRGHGGGAARDGGSPEGRHREHRIRVNGGHPLLPPLHDLCRHQTVCFSILKEPLR